MDYVKRQQIGNLEKAKNEIVLLTVYGVFSGVIFLTKRLFEKSAFMCPGD